MELLNGTLSEWVVASVLSLLFGSVLIAAEIWHRTRRPKPEATRKFVHVMAGLLSMSFSYVLQHHWTVLLLVGGFALLMFVTKRKGLLRSIHGIDRTSEGVIHFPIAIYVLFILSSIFNVPHFYVMSLLVLSLSDTFAALVGKAYGAKRYTVQDELKKSVEGTAAFFLTTFLIVHLGLLFLGITGRVESVLCALLVAILVSAFESISIDGADNLFIPIGTWLVLQKYATASTSDILMHLGLLAGIGVLFFVIMRYPGASLGVSAVIGVTLFGFSAWVLAGFNWFLFVALSVVMFCHTPMLFERTPKTGRLLHIKPIFYASVLPCIWIVLAYLNPEERSLLLIPFIISLSSQFSISWRRNIRLRKASLSTHLPAFLARANAFVRAGILTLLFVPMQLLFEPELPVAFALLASFAGILLVDRLYWTIADNYTTHIYPGAKNSHFLHLSLFVRSAASVLILVVHAGWVNG